MSDKTDLEARNMYDDAIEVIMLRTLTCLTYGIYVVFDSDRWTSYMHFIMCIHCRV